MSGASPDRICHVTSTTGHWRDVHLAEVTDGAVPEIKGLLAAALGDTTRTWPIPAHEAFAHSAEAVPGTLEATVFAYGPPSLQIAPISVTITGPQGAAAWRALHRCKA